MLPAVSLKYSPKYPTNVRLFKDEIPFHLWEKLLSPSNQCCEDIWRDVTALKIHHLLKQSSLFLPIHPSKHSPRNDARHVFFPFLSRPRETPHNPLRNVYKMASTRGKRQKDLLEFGFLPKHQKSGGE